MQSTKITTKLVSLTTGRVRKEPFFLKETLTAKISKQKMLMIFVRREYGREGRRKEKRLRKKPRRKNTKTTHSLENL